MTTPTASETGLLVIGYGNELRGDDGVGPKVAEALDQLRLPGVRTISCHQLTPELAEPVSRAARVVFVDATVNREGGIGLTELKPEETGAAMVHVADPRSLLALARDVFGHCPSAWWLTIPVETMEFGDALSPAARRGVERALQTIQDMIRRG